MIKFDLSSFWGVTIFILFMASHFVITACTSFSIKDPTGLEVSYVSIFRDVKSADIKLGSNTFTIGSSIVSKKTPEISKIIPAVVKSIK